MPPITFEKSSLGSGSSLLWIYRGEGEPEQELVLSSVGKRLERGECSEYRAHRKRVSWEVRVVVDVPVVPEAGISVAGPST